MRSSVFVLLCSLVGTVRSQCCSEEVTLESAVGAADVAFWGKIVDSSFDPINGVVFKAEIDLSVKGCLPSSTRVSIVTTRDACAAQFPFNTDVLVTGAYQGQQTANEVKILATSCGFNQPRSSFYAEQVHALATTIDRCLKKPGNKKSPSQCPDGSNKLNCKKAKMLCNKKHWCSEAKSCIVDPCGGCAPIYFDQKAGAGKQVCMEQCPSGLAQTKCRANPCDFASSDDLRASGCKNWAQATMCVPSTCGGCHAVWTDAMGREVCSEQSTKTVCQSVSGVNFGKGKKKIGFAVSGNSCTAIKGKKAKAAGFTLFKTEQACMAKCQCHDFGKIDLGSCSQSQGWGLKGGSCTQLQGCASEAETISTFKTKAACEASCGGSSSERPNGKGKGAAQNSQDGSDTTAPVIICPKGPQPTSEDVLFLVIPEGEVMAPFMYPSPIASDERPGAQVELLSGQPSGGMFAVGDTKVRWKVSDVAGNSATCEFTVRASMEGQNSSPVSEPLAAVTVTQGVEANIDMSDHFSDPDGDELVYYIGGLPVGTGLTIAFDTGVFTGTPTYADATAPQPIEAKIMAQDGISGRTIQSFLLTVKPDPTNKSPVARVMPSQVATEGTEFSFDVSNFFSDADGDELKYFVADIPYGTGLELFDTGVFKGVPTYADATSPQPLKVRFMASDGKSSAIETLQLTIKPNPNNAVPQSTPIGRADAKEGVVLDLDLSTHFSDGDAGDSLDFFIAGLPFGTGLKLLNTGVLTGTPSLSDASVQQPINLKVLASDGKASTTEQFELHIEADPISGSDSGRANDGPPMPAGVEALAEVEPLPSGGYSQGDAAPTITCPPRVTMQARGKQTIAAEYSTPMVADEDMSTVELFLISGYSVGDMVPVGEHTIQFQARDRYGQTVECSFVLNVKP